MNQGIIVVFILDKKCPTERTRILGLVVLGLEQRIVLQEVVEVDCPVKHEHDHLRMGFQIRSVQRTKYAFVRTVAIWQLTLEGVTGINLNDDLLLDRWLQRATLGLFLVSAKSGKKKKFSSNIL